MSYRASCSNWLGETEHYTVETPDEDYDRMKQQELEERSNPDKERWMTPPEIFDPLMSEFDFDLDAAADTQTYRIPRFIAPDIDALRDTDWPGQRIWLNPPYGRKLEPFVRRAFAEAQKGPTIAGLIPFRCRAAWWHECVIGVAPQVRCFRKRIKFLRPDGTRGDFTMSCDSCLVVWRGAYRGETRMVTA